MEAEKFYGIGGVAGKSDLAHRTIEFPGGVIHDQDWAGLLMFRDRAGLFCFEIGVPLLFPCRFRLGLTEGNIGEFQDASISGFPKRTAIAQATKRQMRRYPDLL